LNSTTDPKSIENIILESLKQGDKNQGELFDLTGKSYPALVQALQQLQSKDLIEIYFVPTEKVSVLTYRLQSGR
jgi:DNA-binding MarR family transcriptional regulator